MIEIRNDLVDDLVVSGYFHVRVSQPILDVIIGVWRLIENYRYDLEVLLCVNFSKKFDLAFLRDKLQNLVAECFVLPCWENRLGEFLA